MANGSTVELPAPNPLSGLNRRTFLIGSTAIATAAPRALRSVRRTVWGWLTSGSCESCWLIMPAFKGRFNLMRRLEELMARDPAVSARTAKLLADLRDEWAGLDRRIKAYDDELAALTREDVKARRFATIPGIGVINATALLAAIGDGSAFAKGRDVAAWLGLTPRQHSTGGKTKLLGISKRGNGYLRKQLIHRARAAMPHLAAKPNQLGTWLQAMLTRAHPNVVVVALAAKLARIAWAVLRHEQDFDRRALVAA